MIERKSCGCATDCRNLIWLDECREHRRIRESLADLLTAMQVIATAPHGLSPDWYQLKARDAINKAADK